MVKISVKAMLGKSIKDQGYEGGLWKRQNLVGVKAPVFSMSKLAGVDTFLGPEMKSTGEVMGIDHEFRPAITKALLAAGMTLPPTGAILLTISDRDKADAVQMIRDLASANYVFYATSGTADLIDGLDLNAAINRVSRRQSSHPNVVDIITSSLVDVVVNTVTGDREVLQDGFHIRRAAVDVGVPCFTSLDTARAAVESMIGSGSEYNIKPLSEYLGSHTPVR